MKRSSTYGAGWAVVVALMAALAAVLCAGTEEAEQIPKPSLSIPLFLPAIFLTLFALVFLIGMPIMMCCCCRGKGQSALPCMLMYIAFAVAALVMIVIGMNIAGKYSSELYEDITQGLDTFAGNVRDLQESLRDPNGDGQYLGGIEEHQFSGVLEVFDQLSEVREVVKKYMDEVLRYFALASYVLGAIPLILFGLIILSCCCQARFFGCLCSLVYYVFGVIFVIVGVFAYTLVPLLDYQCRRNSDDGALMQQIVRSCERQVPPNELNAAIEAEEIIHREQAFNSLISLADNDQTTQAKPFYCENIIPASVGTPMELQELYDSCELKEGVPNGCQFENPSNAEDRCTFANCVNSCSGALQVNSIDVATKYQLSRNVLHAYEIAESVGTCSQLLETVYHLDEEKCKELQVGLWIAGSGFFSAFASFFIGVVTVLLRSSS